MRISTGSADEGFPSVVLFADDDHDTLDMYSTYFEMSGVWVTPSAVSSDVIGGASDLHPDVVVIDAPGHQDAGRDLVHTLKSRDDTHDIPIIVLIARPGALDEADLYLMKPVPPDTLLRHVEILADRARAIREQSRATRAKTAETKARAASLRAQAEALSGGAHSRPCPQCGSPLEWAETTRLGSADYDYYRWCSQGCGLYCFDRAAARWTKLA